MHNPAKSASSLLVTYDDGQVHHLYEKNPFAEEISGYVNFFRRDSYRTVAYYYVANETAE